jgi:uncharacterized protein (TIGR02246 family)
MMSEDERAIRELIATWLRASAEGDTATVLGLMSDDVVFLVPGRPPFGKEAFAGAQQGMAGYRMEAESDVREIRTFGDWAYCWTRLSVAMTPVGGGPTVRRSGHTLTILRKESDGRWLLARDANMLTVDTSGAGG